ncbi:hypothetical protein TNCV_1792771 [Trichonephila clavipes]|nr:hypothetical protein TNCV_1792771 [Trichonephila clavipes]
MIYEVFLHLLQCALTLFFRNALPSFFKIFILDLMLGLFKAYSPTQLFDGNLLETSPAAQPRTTVGSAFLLFTLSPYGRCARTSTRRPSLFPLPKATALPPTPHRGIDQTTTVPLV